MKTAQSDMIDRGKDNVVAATVDAAAGVGSDVGVAATELAAGAIEGAKELGSELGKPRRQFSTEL